MLRQLSVYLGKIVFEGGEPRVRVRSLGRRTGAIATNMQTRHGPSMTAAGAATTQSTPGRQNQAYLVVL